MLIPSYHSALVQLLRCNSASPVPSLPYSTEGWSRLVSAAEDEGLSAYLLDSLRQWEGRIDIPSTVRTQLQNSVRATAFRCLRFAEELRTILKVLAAHNLAALPLRGLALPQQISGLHAARPMGDIDLLIKWRDLDAVASALERLGYRPMDRRPGFAASFSYTLEYVKEQHGWIIVEPHWTLGYPPAAERIDMDATWRRAEPATLLGVPTLRLAGSDLCLHLCLHLAHKGPNARLLWWYELDRLIRFNLSAKDWVRCMEAATASGQAGLFTGVLSALHRLLGTPIPGLPGIEPADMYLMSRGERLLAETDLDGRESLAQLLHIKELTARLRFVWGIAVPAKHFMRLRYPTTRAPLPLLYCARIGFLLWLTALMMARILRLRLMDAVRTVQGISSGSIRGASRL